MIYRSMGIALLALAGCQSKNAPIDGGSNTDGGTRADTGFAISVLDGDPMDLQPISMAIDSNDRVSVAYYKSITAGSTYSIQYLEWKNGNVTGSASLPTLVDGGVQVTSPVQRSQGLSVAIQPNDQPAVAFMGGNDPTQAFWYQHEAYLASRSSGGVWTSQSLVQNGAQASPPLNPAFNGILVGVWPALAFDSANAYYLYRNCHNGQFDVQDWRGSDSEVVSGSSGAGWTISRINEETFGFGGHNQIVLANGQPAVAFDSMTTSVGSPEGGGKDVYFQLQQSVGNWSPTLPQTKSMMPVVTSSNTQSGPSLAYDDSAGFGIAVVDHSNPDLLAFTQLTKAELQKGTAAMRWTTADPVWGSGSGGWYPSLAFNPSTHLPHIAFYICDSNPHINDRTQCRPQEQQLAIAYYGLDQTWHTQPVDYAGGWWPKLGFLSTGKRVVVYRAINGDNVGQLKIAVEK